MHELIIDLSDRGRDVSGLQLTEQISELVLTDGIGNMRQIVSFFVENIGKSRMRHPVAVGVIGVGDLLSEDAERRLCIRDLSRFTR